MSTGNAEETTIAESVEYEKKIWLKRIRNLAGFLGMMLPWISLLGTLIFSKTNPNSIPSEYWDIFSISATYYVTPALAGILTTAAIVLMCYKGYDRLDNIITSLSGLFGVMIVIFPCRCPIAPELVGFFQLPVGTSHIIHSVSAVAFFLILAYNSMFQFTKGKSDTKNKRIKKVIYRVCAIGMLCAMVLMPLPFKFFAKTFIIEAIALTFFGISWLIKGEVFGILSDD